MAPGDYDCHLEALQRNSEHSYAPRCEQLKAPCQTTDDADALSELFSILSYYAQYQKIVEGAGKTSKLDKKRYYGIARGSALECAAILDAVEVLKLSDEDSVLYGKKLLYEVVAMLSTLCLKQ